MTGIRLNPKAVLILTAEGTHRETWRKAFHNDGYTAKFVSATSQISDLLNDIKPKVFLQDWTTVDESQGRQLQHRLSRLSEFVGLCRFILAPSITPQLVALASDSGVAKVIPLATPALGVVGQVAMTLSTLGTANELQRKINELRIGKSNYSQAEIDALVEATYAKYPHDCDVRLEYGNLIFRRDDLKSARAIGEDILQNIPTHVRAMNLVARVSMKWGRFDEAVSLLSKADSLSPENPARLVLLGHAFYGNGDPIQAERFYLKASTIDPECKEAQSSLGQMKLSQGDAESALSLFRNSISEEEAAGFFNNAAVAAVKKGQFADGLKLYETALRALKTAQNKPQILFNVALAYKRLDQIAPAIKLLKRALKINPAFDKARRLLDALESEATRKV